MALKAYLVLMMEKQVVKLITAHAVASMDTLVNTVRLNLIVHKEPVALPALTMEQYKERAIIALVCANLDIMEYHLIAQMQCNVRMYKVSNVKIRGLQSEKQEAANANVNRDLKDFSAKQKCYVRKHKISNALTMVRLSDSTEIVLVLVSQGTKVRIVRQHRLVFQAAKIKHVKTKVQHKVQVIIAPVAVWKAQMVHGVN